MRFIFAMLKIANNIAHGTQQKISMEKLAIRIMDRLVFGK